MCDIFEKRDFFAEKASVPSLLKWGDPQCCPDPRVTIIMPVYKRPEFFSQALRSVLEQDYEQPYEVIVVDNNEEENSPNQAVVEQMADTRVLYYRNAENLGMYRNWNRGVELARAPYVTFCHDDDLLLPGALRRLMALQARFGEQCILSAYQFVDAEGNVTGTSAYRRRVAFLKPRSVCRYSLFLQLMGNVSCGDGSLYARRCILDIGGYNPNLYPVADYAMNVAYAHFFGAIINNVPSSSYRVAVNESIRIYQESPTLFADKTRTFIHGPLKSQSMLPGKLVDWFIRILYRNSIESNASFWCGEGRRKAGLRPSERLVMRLALTVSRLKRYQFFWAGRTDSA